MPIPRFIFDNYNDEIMAQYWEVLTNADDTDGHFEGELGYDD